MSIAEVLPVIDSLPNSDKFQLVQLILSQLAKEDQSNTLVHMKSKPKPIGKVYYSGHSDVSRRAKDMLFKEKLEMIQQRSKS